MQSEPKVAPPSPPSERLEVPVLAPPASQFRRLTYDDHRRTMDALRYVYPVLSRRAKGISLGINLNPDKACNFDCVYCQVDRTVPGARGVDVSAISQELSKLLSWVADGTLFEHPPFDTVAGSMRRVNDVCFAGDGEPTSAPELLPAVQEVIRLKEQFGLTQLKTVLITNASLLHKPRVQEALALMDQANGEVWAKLDAGTEAYYHRVCVTRVAFSRILKNLELTAQVRPLVIQSLFLEIDGAGPPPEELEAYIGRLQALREAGGALKLIQIYTVARKPPEPNVFALTNAALDAIVDQVARAIPVPVEAYYGSQQFIRPSQP